MTAHPATGALFNNYHLKAGQTNGLHIPGMTPWFSESLNVQQTGGEAEKQGNGHQLPLNAHRTVDV